MEKKKISRASWRVRYIHFKSWNTPRTTCELNLKVAFFLLCDLIKFSVIGFVAYLLFLFAASFGNEAAMIAGLDFYIPEYKGPEVFKFGFGVWTAIKLAAFGVISLLSFVASVACGVAVFIGVLKGLGAILFAILHWISMNTNAIIKWHKFRDKWSKFKGRFCKQIEYT